MGGVELLHILGVIVISSVEALVGKLNCRFRVIAMTLLFGIQPCHSFTVELVQLVSLPDLKA